MSSVYWHSDFLPLFAKQRLAGFSPLFMPSPPPPTVVNTVKKCIMCPISFPFTYAHNFLSLHLCPLSLFHSPMSTVYFNFLFGKSRRNECTVWREENIPSENRRRSLVHTLSCLRSIPFLFSYSPWWSLLLSLICISRQGR